MQAAASYSRIAPEFLQAERNGIIGRTREIHDRADKIIPDSDRGQNDARCDNRLHQRQDDLEQVTDITGTIHPCGLIQIAANRLDVADKHHEHNARSRRFQQDITELGIIPEERYALLEGQHEFILGHHRIRKKLGQQKNI